MEKQRQLQNRIERMILTIPRSVNFVVIATLLVVLLLMLERDHESSAADTTVQLKPVNYAEAMTNALERKLSATSIEKYGITMNADPTENDGSDVPTHLVLRIRGLKVDSQPHAYQALLASQKASEPIDAELIMTTRVFLDATGTEMLRVDAQLINSDDGFRLWSHEFESEVSDLDTIYLEICRALSEAMELTVDGANEGHMVHGRSPLNPDTMPRT